MNRNRRNFPRTYAYAAERLFSRRVQRLRLNDDLTLCFVRGGAAALYNDKVLVRWSADGRRVHLVASREDRGATPRVVEFVSQFIPLGYHVQCNRVGRMLLHTPLGQTTVGNRQRIDLPETVDWYDPF